MPFDPEDFFRLAKDMLGENREELDEARARTIIGRSYYSVFLKARDKVIQINPLYRDQLISNRDLRENVHSNLINILRSPTASANSKKLAQYLLDLRQKRNDADYNIHIRLKYSHAQRCIEEAKTAIRFINLLNAIRTCLLIGK